MISSAPLRTWGSCCWSRTLPRIPAISGSLCWCPICPSRSSWTRLSGGPQVAALIFMRPALVQTFCSGLGCSPSSWCTMQACIGQSQLHPWLLRLCNAHKENRHYQETLGTSSNWMIPRVQAHGTWQLVRPTEPCAVCPCWILLLLSLQWKSPSGNRYITFGIVVWGHVTACNPENLSSAGDISEHLRVHARMFGSICALVEGWHMIPVRGAHKENTLSEKVLLNHWPDCVLAKSTLSCSPQWTKLIAKLWVHRPPHSLICGYHHSLSL